MKIGNIILIGFVTAVSALIAAKYISNSTEPVKLVEKSFYCSGNSCEYIFELENTSNDQHSGIVHIHFRDNLGIGSYKSTASMLGTVEKSFMLKPNESVVISDIYKTDRQNINVYYAVSTNKT
ncbi:hypothetical protein [Catenovulum adriaticum]|uniref:Uncharacterized protein n=1 Tax=Catenovulum adriaticum TaxID=2984846 RepID=A0ABY7AQP3_9ALTE|nr:hypothetical protein [Catenovulum sp. TS8]WAJ71870.1 hypothetical protein OLW01_14165 [Catenovulum sp. TS8]